MNREQYLRFQRRFVEFFQDSGIDYLSVNTEDTGGSEPYFSWRPCECCLTSKGGNRYLCSAVLSGQDVEFEICGDCVYYQEYGRLDDQQMDEIEKSS